LLLVCGEKEALHWGVSTDFMEKPNAQSTAGFPLFERPSEAVVFWALENLCRSAGGKCSITFADLSQRCSLAQSTIKRAVHHLAKGGVIRFQPGCNQYQTSVYEIACGNSEMLTRRFGGQDDGKDDEVGSPRTQQADLKAGRKMNAGADVSQSRSAGLKIGRPNPSDISCISNDLYIGDKHDKKVVHSKQGNGDPSDEERLAFQVADGLGDVKNLRLYKSYCRRYPTEIILTAYVRAREVSPDKIKKSRGALFNFLVQKYGGKNKNKSGNPGSAPWAQGNGRGCAGRG
jgi:hypothetical protein